MTEEEKSNRKRELLIKQEALNRISNIRESFNKALNYLTEELSKSYAENSKLCEEITDLENANSIGKTYLTKTEKELAEAKETIANYEKSNEQLRKEICELIEKDNAVGHNDSIFYTLK